MERRRNKWLMKSIFLTILTLTLVFAWMLDSRAEQKPSLAILPFFIVRIENPERGAVICPLCKGIYQYGEVFPGSQNILTQLLYVKIERLEKFRILPLEKVEETLSPSMIEQFEKKPIPSTIEIGKEMGADFILVGYLFRFEERVGSSIGVERPASVGFDVHLFRLKDGVEVWMGKFDETQRPLSDNLLKIGAFIKGKASWLRAEDLAGLGMDEMLKKLPGTTVLEKAP